MAERRTGPGIAALAATAALAALVLMTQRVGDANVAPVAVAEQSQQQQLDSILNSIQECPHSWRAVYARARPKEATASPYPRAPGPGFAPTGRSTDVPEFNDCQRLLLPNGAYGPLIAVFAAWDLERLDTLVARDLQVRVPDRPELGVSTQIPPTLSGRRGRGARGRGVSGPPVRRVGALILNLGADYQVEDFVIRRGFSCLYLWPAPRWQARIVPVPTDDDCLRPILPDTFSTPAGGLKVVEDWQGGSTLSDYPPVARWDRDAQGRPYIGIKCGSAWCEVGGVNFTPNPPYVGPFPNANVARVRRIKGWYDEQLLAVPDNTGKLVPSPLKGTIFPDPALDGYVDADFDRNWARVAYVALDGGRTSDYTHYLTKFGLQRAPVTAPFEQLNRIEMCHGSSDQCQIARSEVPKCGPTQVVPPATEVRWWARVSAPGVPRPRHNCVVFLGHAGLGKHIPGTARWRWIIADEATWTRCVQGCCEMDNNS